VHTESEKCCNGCNKTSDQQNGKLRECKPVKYQEFIKLLQNFNKQGISIIFGDYKIMHFNWNIQSGAVAT